MSNTYTDVTVVITAFNRVKILPRAIISVINQTYPNWDLVIVDDCSTDGTEALIRTYTDKRIRYIRHVKNLGSGVSINTGILSSKMPYICILDSDDEYTPDFLEKHVAMIKNVPDEVGFVYSQIGEKGSDGTLNPAHFNLIRGHVYKQALWQGYLAPMISLIIKRECFNNIGLFDITFPCFKDDDICFRLAKNYAVDYIPEVLAEVHRDAPTQLTRDRKKYAIGWYSLIEKFETEIIKECGYKRLARHYIRASWLYIKAGQIPSAFHAWQKSVQAGKTPFLFGKILFDALIEKANRSKHGSSATHEN